MLITKEQINELGFHKIIGSNNFFKPGWLLWAMELEGGNTYGKLAIKPDLNDSNSHFDKWEYFHDLDSLKAFLYKQENLPHLENCLGASFPAPMYNHEPFNYPSEGY